MSSIQLLLITTVEWFFNIMYALVLVRVILSWIRLRPGKLTLFIFNTTEPILRPIRRMLNNSPIGGGGLDFSPVIAIFLMELVSGLLIRLIYMM